ncbi:kinesin light chain isoform X1 [Brassica napus]|uniref:kinesin light chain isoform X1 n=1 Tax=Brassica napus TaxID=3708 RepID=UPI002078C3F9|nr:kinesin light chain isoform X1 [Brassica napus]
MSMTRIMSALLRRTHSFSSSRAPVSTTFASSLSVKPKISYQNDYGGHTRKLHLLDPRLWIIFSGQAAILGFCGNVALAEDDPIKPRSGDSLDGSGLERIEDGSVVSNIHTSKWRVFTDSGREHFFQGKLEPAERLFGSAIHEAKEGFGERDPHVASACNNLTKCFYCFLPLRKAELYRVKKEFDKAEPLYLEAVSILEEYYGPEDVRVGATLHNLGQLYLVQRKLEEARSCYERALKMKRRVLGHNHPDYAETMYHLGTVLHLQGKDTDAEALILDSLKILEDNGQGESMTYIRRLRYLSQIYIRSNRLADAENIQRKLLHMMELSKGWNSMETVIAAEALAVTLQLSGQLREAQELFEKCLNTQKKLLPEGHIQIGGNFLHMAKTFMLQATQLRGTNNSEALSKLDKAKDYLGDSSRIAKDVLLKLKNQKGKEQKQGKSSETLRNYEHAALVILLRSLDSLAVLETSKNEIPEAKERDPHAAEDALLECLSAYKEFGCGSQLQDSPEVKTEYVTCLKHLSVLLANKETKEASPISIAELKEEVKRIEMDLIGSHKKGS